MIQTIQGGSGGVNLGIWLSYEVVFSQLEPLDGLPRGRGEEIVPAGAMLQW